MEVQKEEEGNPMAQDTEDAAAASSSATSPSTGGTRGLDKGKPSRRPRFYAWPSLVNYGALPRTYEHPGLADPATGRVGDGDPVDAVDVCPTPCEVGEVYAVATLGALALLDGDATDWKIVTSRVGCLGGAMNDAARDLRDLVDTRGLAESAADAEEEGSEGAVNANPGDAGSTTPGARSAANPAPPSSPNDAASASFPLALGPGHALPPAPSVDPETGRKPPRKAVRAWLQRLLPAMRVWFRDYKRAAKALEKLEGTKKAARGSGASAPDDSRAEETASLLAPYRPNAFAFGGAYLDSASAISIVLHTHAQWCALILQLVAEGRGDLAGPSSSPSSAADDIIVDAPLDESRVRENGPRRPAADARARLAESLAAVHATGVRSAGLGNAGEGSVAASLAREACGPRVPLARDVFDAAGVAHLVDWGAATGHGEADGVEEEGAARG
jgi:hypothetical protein